MRESIVLQLGNYSNHVGSHFWNIQSSSAVSEEAEDGDSERFEGSRLYRRSGEAASGYVPRVLMGDLPENTGHILIAGESTVATAPKARSTTDSGENSENILLWDGTTRRIQKDHYPVHPFQTYQQVSAQMLMGSIDPTSTEHDFFSEKARGGGIEGYERPDERTIKTWCDYMGTPIHSKSYLDLPLQYNSRNFDHFAAALNHDRTSLASIVDKYLESFRYFAEECDTLTSVQVFADCFDGFSVLTKELVQEIREDYRGVAMPVWAFTDAPLAHTLDGRVWRPSPQQGSTMNSTLRNLSFSYSAASMLDGGASAIVPISGVAAAAAVEAAYGHLHGAGAAGSTGQSARGAGESKLSSPLRPGLAEAGKDNLLYLSSSAVAAGVDAVLSMDLLRGFSAAERRVDFINGHRTGGGGDERAHRESGGVSASSSSGDMWEILYHATNAGRFPCLSLETVIPLSSSPSALMRRVEERFTQRGRGAITSQDAAAQMLQQQQGRLNPFLTSLSAAHHYSWTVAARQRRRRRGQGRVLEDDTVASFFDSPDEEDALEEAYHLADAPDDEYEGGGGGSGSGGAGGQSALSNVLCVRGAIAREQFGFDKYLWGKASSQEGYDDYGKDLSSRRYYLTRCMQRQSALHVPASFPAAITASLAGESSSKLYSREVCSLSALGADPSTMPQFLSAHATLWAAASAGRGGALLTQLQKVGLAAEDACEAEERLRLVAGNYKDESL